MKFPRFRSVSPVRRLVWATLGASALLAAPTLSAQVKLAVIDTQRAVMETEDGLRASATLKKLFDNRQRELDQRQNDLQREREDIEKQRSVLSKEALQKRVDKWQREMMDIQGVFVEYNKELQKKQNEITQPILQKMMTILRRMATQDGYDVVVEKQVVPYHRSDLDLTDRLITLYNSGGNAVEPAPAQQAPAPKLPAPAPAAAPAPLAAPPLAAPKAK